jgi:hypothetical protein
MFYSNFKNQVYEQNNEGLLHGGPGKIELIPLPKIEKQPMHFLRKAPVNIAKSKCIHAKRHTCNAP